MSNRLSYAVPDRPAYAMLFWGVVLDELSTRLVLTYLPGGYEANRFTVHLMELGLWLPFDMLLILLGIAIPYYLLKRWNRWEPLVFPLAVGLIRLVFGVHNLLLLF